MQRPANDQTKTRVQRIKEIISNYAENKSQPIVKQKETIINSSMATDQMKTEKGDDIADEDDEIVITAQDIILSPFTREGEIFFNDSMINNITPGQESDSRQIKHHALNAYLSTPKFVKTLTDISNELITVANREEYLQEELLKLNRQLPAAVYIPFVNGKLLFNL